MKRLILTAFLCLSALVASAQYVVDHDHDIQLKGSRVFVDGERVGNDIVLESLTASCGDDVAKLWAKNRRAYKAGLGLTIAGSSLEFLGGMSIVGGILTTAVGGMYVPILGIGAIISGDYSGVKDVSDEIFGTAEVLVSVGGYAALAGLAMLASGIPTMCVYKKKLNGMVQEYGPGFTSDVNLTLGPAPNGFGFTLNF